jgi:hypothetical protein
MVMKNWNIGMLEEWNNEKVRRQNEKPEYWNAGMVEKWRTEYRPQERVARGSTGHGARGTAKKS